MSLVIVGSVGLDSVKTPAGEVNEVPGGSANYASMASRNFCKTHIVGVVGDDFPEEHVTLLQNHGICTQGLDVKNGRTFRWKGEYNDLNRAETLDTQLNVFADFDPKIPEVYRDSDYIFLGNIDPVLQLRVLDQMNETKLTACDTMNFWIDSKKDELLEVIRRVDVLFINEDEIKMLSGETNIFTAAEQIKKYGPKLIIVKRGEYGSVAIGQDFVFFAPVYPVKNVVDPTGAGDSFAGGFMGYISGQDRFDEDAIRNAVIYGTVMASFNVEAFSLERLTKLDMASIDLRRDEIRTSVLF